MKDDYAVLTSLRGIKCPKTAFERSTRARVLY